MVAIDYRGVCRANYFSRRDICGGIWLYRKEERAREIIQKE